ncbi:DinB family protein [Rhodohalobacter sp. 614A]|uniref:DinB family protein n=1 Tax=Rhodohalobacter sp. 614A TaxID=2908649 RepID=UPI001F36FDA3|nr:DinB family protein [Rhodohalobacter sp. 614A]
MSNSALTDEIIDHAVYRLNENTPRIKKCLDQLTEEEIWKRPNESSNSVGNLILHLCGNITQYTISSLGGKKDSRKRDMEFDTRGGYSKAELFEKLSSTVDEAVEVIKNLNEDALMKIRSVQGFEYSGVGNIIHVVEHYSYHTGQIAFWTKLLKDQDLGFYDGVDLNAKNK